MTLVKAGVWHTTVWADRTWPENLWLEYGTAAAPEAPTPTGSRRYIVSQPPRTERDLTPPEKPVLEVIPQPLPVGMTFAELVRYAHEMLSIKHATVEDLRQILEPLLPQSETGKDPYDTLRELLAGVPVPSKEENDKLFMKGLAEILRKAKKEMN